jgi:hypothetical protein
VYFIIISSELCVPAPTGDPDVVGWILLGASCAAHVLNGGQQVYGPCGMVRSPCYSRRPLRLLSWCRRVALPSLGARICLSYCLLLFRRDPVILAR